MTKLIFFINFDIQKFYHNEGKQINAAGDSNIFNLHGSILPWDWFLSGIQSHNDLCRQAGQSYDRFSIYILWFIQSFQGLCQDCRAFLHKR